MPASVRSAAGRGPNVLLTADMMAPTIGLYSSFLSGWVDSDCQIKKIIVDKSSLSMSPIKLLII